MVTVAAAARGPLPPLGAHLSTRGGLAQAIRRGIDLGCTAGQIFVKNPQQWRGRPLAADEAAAFRTAHAASAIGPLLAHGAYLHNLAAPSPAVRERTVAALRDELVRCAALGIVGLVVHPGAHLDAGTAHGIRRAAAAIDRAFAELPADGPRLLLELTVGCGTLLGGSLGELAAIIAASRYPERLGVCVDTCHAFAAGYAIHEPDGYERFWEELATTLGRERLGALHLNDSRHAFGSRRDRHASIGEGAIGDATFARLLADPRLRTVPMVIETPDPDERGHARDLARLRALAASVAAGGAALNSQLPSS